MNYTSDPVADADSYTSKLARLNDAYQAAEIAMIDDFMKLALAGDMNAPATFAPMVGEFINGRWTAAVRYPTIAECMLDALGYGSGPCVADLMVIFSSLARFTVGGVTTAPLAARKLLRRMAETYASMNVEVEE